MTETPHIEPCPFCKQKLTVKTSINPMGKCDTPDCWMHRRAYAIPLDDPEQVRQWNECAAPRVSKEITFQSGPTMAQVTYAEFLEWIAERLEHVHGERPNVDYMLRLRELAASVVPADADSAYSSEPVTPQMIAAGMRVLNQARIRLGPGPCLADAYRAMRAAREK